MLYNVNDQVLKTTDLTQQVIISEEYFWNDDRVKIIADRSINLEEIDYQFNVQCQKSTYVTDLSFKYFGMLQNLKSLKLQLRNWGNGNYSITNKAFCFLGLSFKNLRILHLDLRNWGHLFSQITNFGLVSLFQAIPDQIQDLNLNLNYLGYRNQQITGECLYPIGDLLNQKKELQYLKLHLAEWGNDYNKTYQLFADQDLIYLLSKIYTQEPRQIYIDLTGWGCYQSLITDESAQYIILLLKQSEQFQFKVETRGWMINHLLRTQINNLQKQNQQISILSYQITAVKSILSQFLNVDKLNSIINKLVIPQDNKTKQDQDEDQEQEQQEEDADQQMSETQIK
ncbi:hypothetical protein pb186bvf_013711 [Paramecium bursaria]